MPLTTTDSPAGAAHWTVRAVARRFVEVAREEGTRALWFKLIGETVYRRLIIFERLCAGVPGLVAEVPVALEQLGEEDLPEIRALQSDVDATALSTRLSDGHLCFGAWLEGRLVHVAWVARGRMWSDYLRLELPLAPDEACTYETFTSPAVRGMGIGPALRAKTLIELERSGHARLLATILPENRSGRRLVEKLGYRRIGLVGYLGTGRWRRGFCLMQRGERRPGAPHG